MCCKYHIRGPLLHVGASFLPQRIFIMAFHTGAEWSLVVLLTCTPLINHDIQHVYIGELFFFFKQLDENLQLIVFLLSFCCFQSLSPVSLFVTPWTAACQAPLSFTISQSFLKFLFIESVVLPNHLILCHSLLLLPSIFPRIRVFSNESVLHIRWSEYWSFSFSISPKWIFRTHFL